MTWRSTSGWVLIVAATGVACSGQSKGSSAAHGEGEEGGSSGSGAIGGGAGSAGSGVSAGNGGEAAGEGAGGRGGSAGSYVPEQPDVPSVGDGRISGGSLEGAQGSGWDFCFTNHPGAALLYDDPTASAGTSYATFDSALTCVSPCRPDGDDVQLGLWLDASVPDDTVHLYFDALNLDDEAPSGLLRFDTVGGATGCASDESLATVDLSALALTNEWQTRCVTFTPEAPFQVFGLYVSGERFHIALDAFRFGPPCHTD
jgi:hypothetical protein